MALPTKFNIFIGRCCSDFAIVLGRFCNDFKISIARGSHNYTTSIGPYPSGSKVIGNGTKVAEGPPRPEVEEPNYTFSCSSSRVRAAGALHGGSHKNDNVNLPGGIRIGSVCHSDSGHITQIREEEIVLSDGQSFILTGGIQKIQTINGEMHINGMRLEQLIRDSQTADLPPPCVHHADSDSG